MNKKKQVVPVAKAGTTAENDELAKKIGETMSVLKGGKVVKTTKSTLGNKSDVVVEYKLGTKTYTVTGRHNQRTGEFHVSKV